MNTDQEPSRGYEIRVAGALGEGLMHVFADMRVMRLGPGSLLRLEVPAQGWDAADIVAVLCARGHSVSSVRKCEPTGRAPGNSLRARNDQTSTGLDQSEPDRHRDEVPDQGP